MAWILNTGSVVCVFGAGLLWSTFLISDIEATRVIETILRRDLAW